MKHWSQGHIIAVLACVAALFVFYMIATSENPFDTPGKQHPEILWGYDPSESNCSDSTDNDGDGQTDCNDVDDCSDSSGCTEDCTNTVDDDGDGAVDCNDLWCQSYEPSLCGD